MSNLNFIDRMSLGLGEKLSYVFLISVIITCYEVVMRYVFNAPTTWVHDGATALSATGFLMAGCYCLQARRHIAITVIYDAVPQKVRNVLALTNALLIVVFLGLLTWADESRYACGGLAGLGLSSAVLWTGDECPCLGRAHTGLS